MSNTIVKLKLELPNGDIHRFRTKDSYTAWKWCIELAKKYDEGESPVAFEDTMSGFVLANPLDFARYFTDLSSKEHARKVADECDGILLRLKALPTKKVSFRLARDVSREFHMNSGSEDASFILESQRIGETCETRAAEKPAFKLAADDFRPSAKGEGFSLGRDADRNPLINRDSGSFVLAKDQVDLNLGVHGGNGQKEAHNEFRLASDDDVSRLLRAYRT